RHRHPRSAARAQPELPEDRRHGDPRSACGALRRPDRAARQGRVDRCRGYAMTWARFVWCNLRRHPLRTTLTTLSIGLSIFLVCAVLTLPGTLNMILERATSDTRISVHHKAGLTYWLPYAYLARVRAIPHVTAVNHYSWFGGVYDEPRNMFPNFAVDPDTVEQMWPDYRIDPEALQRFRTIRDAAIVGYQTMRKFGWRGGQEVTLKGTVFPIDLTFQIVGEIPPNGTANPPLFPFHT